MNSPSTTDWQTWAALAVVAFTVVIFTIAIVRRRKNSKASSGCSSGCGCGKPSLSSGDKSSPNLRTPKP